MRFYLAQSVRKDLQHFSVTVQNRILDKLEWIELQPDPLKYARPLQGHPRLCRFRIGDYRVIVECTNTILHVLSIDKRDKVYDKY